MCKVSLDILLMVPCLMVVVTEFVILRIQIHARQCFRGGGDRYKGLVGHADVVLFEI